MSGPSDHDHDHPHPHAETGAAERPGYFDRLETAVRELLIDKGHFTAGEIRRQIEVLDSRTPGHARRPVSRSPLRVKDGAQVRIYRSDWCV